MNYSKLMPSFDNIDTWAKDNITKEFLFNLIEAGIHPIHWVKQDIVQKMYDDYLLRACYSIDKKYYKINYGNVSFREFELYPFLYFCRGDVLTVDGDIIVAKAPNKFWNVNENPLTQKDNINWNKIKVFEKLDGIMILPFKDNNEWRLSSRGSFEYEGIQIALQYFNDEYKGFCEILSKHNLYPCFELISKESFIKVEYPDEKYGLYCFGCVDSTGEFHHNIEFVQNISERYNIKTPKQYSFNTFDEVYGFINGFDHYYDFEGVMVRTQYGSVKLKSDKYCEMNIQNLDNPKKLYDIWVDSQLDDVLPHISAEMRNNILTIINKFKAIKTSLNEEYDKIYPKLENMNEIKEVVEYLNINCDKKLFHFFLNRYKNVSHLVEKSRKNLILNEVEKNG